MQVQQFNKLVTVLGSFTTRRFTIGVCSVSVYQPPQAFNNVSVINYGWLKEEEVRELGRKYQYGLLPLSFDRKDELFYKTSLMTKIPFYTSMLLPIICIGPGTASAVQLIRREATGLVAVAEDGSDLPALVEQAINMDTTGYNARINQLKKSAATTFSFDLIAERFYRGMA